MSTAPQKALPTDEEIIARFHRLRITIGLSATNFGYSATGQPNLIKRLTEGHSIRINGRRRCATVLDTLEREHSVPVPASREHNENKLVDSKSTKENIPINRSDMED